MINPPKGTRDFYPDNLVINNWLINIWNLISKSFNYKEYNPSIIEHADLWINKSGTPQILDEMFLLSNEKFEKQLVLRPEITPSFLRMIHNCSKTEIIPIKWYTISQCFRNESSSFGRKREFFQWNIDIGISIDMDIIKTAMEIFNCIISFFKKVNLTKDDVVIKLSHKNILGSLFKKFNLNDENTKKAFNIIDKFEKLDKSDIFKLLYENINLNYDQINQIFNLINLKYIEKNSILDILINYLNLNNLFEWFEIDFSIVRGLDYYDGIIFEAFSKNKDIKRAILGGGQYKHNELIFFGFGMGDVVIFEILKSKLLIPIICQTVDYIIIPFNFELYNIAFNLANNIREKSDYKLKIEIYFQKEKQIKKALDYANKIKANKSILLMPDEWNNKLIIIKDMNEENIDKKQIILSITDFINSI